MYRVRKKKSTTEIYYANQSIGFQISETLSNIELTNDYNLFGFKFSLLSLPYPKYEFLSTNLYLIEYQNEYKIKYKKFKNNYKIHDCIFYQ